MSRALPAGAVWGANHNWHEVQHKRMKREGENPVPHYWAHVFWVFGASDMDDFLAKSKGMNLNGHMDRIKVPFLVTHGANDRQIGVEYAHQAYAQLTNCPKRRAQDLHRARRRGRTCRRGQHGLWARLHRRLVRRYAGRSDRLTGGALALYSLPPRSAWHLPQEWGGFTKEIQHPKRHNRS